MKYDTFHRPLLTRKELSGKSLGNIVQCTYKFKVKLSNVAILSLENLLERQNLKQHNIKIYE